MMHDVAAKSRRWFRLSQALPPHFAAQLPDHPPTLPRAKAAIHRQPQSYSERDKDCPHRTTSSATHPKLHYCNFLPSPPHHHFPPPINNRVFPWGVVVIGFWGERRMVGLVWGEAGIVAVQFLNWVYHLAAGRFAWLSGYDVGMTADNFRSLALSLPEACESAHMGHPDFRVGGKIFATLGPDEDWGMVKLTPDDQASFLRAEPDAFRPASGAWGRRGSTIIQLRDAKAATVKRALIAAWRNTAPKRLLEE
jgi:hypothetical protein